MLPIKLFVFPSLLCFGYFGVHDRLPAEEIHRYCFISSFFLGSYAPKPIGRPQHLSPFDATQRTVGSLTV